MSFPFETLRVLRFLQFNLSFFGYYIARQMLLKPESCPHCTLHVLFYWNASSDHNEFMEGTVERRKGRRLEHLKMGEICWRLQVFCKVLRASMDLSHRAADRNRVTAPWDVLCRAVMWIPAFCCQYRTPSAVLWRNCTGEAQCSWRGGRGQKNTIMSTSLTTHLRAVNTELTCQRCSACKQHWQTK